MVAYMNTFHCGLFLRFHSEFLNPLSSFSVEYKSESNNANDSKKEDLSQLFGMLLSGNLLASKKDYWFLPKNSDINLETYFFFKDIFIYYINS